MNLTPASVWMLCARGVGAAAANHAHTIVRDPSNDYGEDWLSLHYKEHHPAPR